MRRRAAIIGATAGAALVGSLLFAPTAQAEPRVCVDLHVDVNGQGGAQSICLPPEDGEAPGVPGLPGAPDLPELPEPPLPL